MSLEPGRVIYEAPILGRASRVGYRIVGVGQSGACNWIGLFMIVSPLSEPETTIMIPKCSLDRRFIVGARAGEPT